MGMNKSGITHKSYGSTKQILAVTDVFVSFSCKVTTSGLVKAGTPVSGDISNRLTPFTVTPADGTPVGVIMHDIEPNDGTTIANAAVLVFGWVNKNRVEDDVKALYTTDIVTKLKAAGVTIMSDI